MEIRKVNEHYKELAEQLIESESELNFIKAMGIALCVVSLIISRHFRDIGEIYVW